LGGILGTGSVRSAGNVTVITCNLPRNLRQGKIEKLRVIYVYFKFILSFLKSTLTGLITADKEYICDVDDTDVLSFIHSAHFYSASSSPLYYSEALPTTARILYTGVSRRSAQATVGKGLAQGP